MSAKQLHENYERKKYIFQEYIDDIKRRAKVDFYTIINTTLIKNPYISQFPKKFFLEEFGEKNLFYQFLKSTFNFYTKAFYSFISYLVSFILFKIYYKNSKFESQDFLLIDIFFLVDKIIKESEFKENYFVGLYDILDKHNKNYLFLPRLYGINKNPFKLIEFFKIINQDRRNFLFEFELLSLKDFLSMLFFILLYPFKTLRLLQSGKSNLESLFNSELLKEIESTAFDSFSRYILGKNVAKLSSVDKIYSWSEFQAVERSFNYGVRSNNTHIKLFGCQFYLNYETYLNNYVDDIDFEQKTSFHDVLVNGDYYILDREKIKYKKGVSLRYKDVFSFSKTGTGKNILLLGSYVEKETRNMLYSVSSFENVFFKNHPIVDINRFKKLSSNITVVNDNIYKLFENSELVIGTASGTSVEAVACGISVIIIASQENLTANPLVEYGKGKIWDIAFSKDDVKKVYNDLIEYRNNNKKEIKEIASWYRDNFFIEPTEENIIKAFELEVIKQSKDTKIIV